MAGNKYLSNNSGVITENISNQTSAGAGDAGKIVALASDGRLDLTLMPTGIGQDNYSIVASEALSDGNVVNIWNNSGVANVRKADATVAGKEAMGFVLSAVSSGETALVYFEGNNTSVSGLTAGKQYLSTTAGTVTTTAPSLSGNVVQVVGFSASATELNFQSREPIVLA